MHLNTDLLFDRNISLYEISLLDRSLLASSSPVMHAGLQLYLAIGIDRKHVCTYVRGTSYAFVYFPSIVICHDELYLFYFLVFIYKPLYAPIFVSECVCNSTSYYYLSLMEYNL
jgi:hypothetical protein